MYFQSINISSRSAPIFGQIMEGFNKSICPDHTAVPISWGLMEAQNSPGNHGPRYGSRRACIVICETYFGMSICVYGIHN